MPTPLTIVVLLLAGIALARFFADAIKAAALVLIVAAVFVLMRNVSFEALVDQGSHALFDDQAPCHYARPPRRI